MSEDADETKEPMDCANLVRPEFRDAVRARRSELGRSWPVADRDEYEAHLRSLLAGAVLSVRVPLAALLSILHDRRFKTRHEGSMSRNPTRNTDEESAVWCLDPSRPATFPIFGYLATEKDISEPAARASLHSAYGSARVLLSDDLRDRATVFFGDSLAWIRGSTGAPAPLTEPDELTWPFDRGLPTDRVSLDGCAFDEVVELQIIGGITLDEITEVIFDFDPPERVKRALGCAGIDWNVNPMPTLPGWLAERFSPERLDDAEAGGTSSEG